MSTDVQLGAEASARRLRHAGTIVAGRGHIANARLASAAQARVMTFFLFHRTHAAHCEESGKRSAHLY
jgi:hypothetical protein